MQSVIQATDNTKTAGALKAGDGKYIFPMSQLAGIDAGIGYSTAFGPVVEGERMQVALVTKAKGTGAKPHTHPNEQWNYIVQGTYECKLEISQNSFVGLAHYCIFQQILCTLQLPRKTAMWCF